MTVSDGSLVAAVAACFSSRGLVRAADFDTDTELKRGVTDLKRYARALRLLLHLHLLCGRSA